jgi:hypothetical protein
MLYDEAAAAVFASNGSIYICGFGNIALSSSAKSPIFGIRQATSFPVAAD